MSSRTTGARIWRGLIDHDVAVNGYWLPASVAMSLEPVRRIKPSGPNCQFRSNVAVRVVLIM